MILSVYNIVFLHFFKNANILQYEITLVLSICHKEDKWSNIIHSLQSTYVIRLCKELLLEILYSTKLINTK